MNKEIVGSVIRWGVTLIAGTSIGAVIVASGVTDPATITDLAGKVSAAITSIVALASLLWSIWQKIKAARKLHAAVIAPAVPEAQVAK